MKNTAKTNKDQSFARSIEQQQQEDRLESQIQNANYSDHVGQEFKTIKKVMIPIIFMVLLSLICMFSYNFMSKLRDNRQIMMNIILSEQKNAQIFQEEINSLVELKQEVKGTYTDGKQKEDTQLVHKLQGRLKQFEQKINNLQNRLESLSAKTSEKEDVAKLAITEANQIKQQLKLVNNNLLKTNPSIKSFRKNQADQAIKNLFQIPKNIWIFSSEYPNYLRKKCIQRGFTVQLLNFESANQFLSKQSVDDLKQAIKSVTQNNRQISKRSIDKLQIKLILLNFLNEYGGIAMDGNLAMTEDIKWIESIPQNKFVKKHYKSIPPQIVSFYRPEKSIYVEGTNDDFSQYPLMEYFFLAASRDTLFLPNYIKAIYTTLQTIFQKSNQPQIKVTDDGNRQFYEQILDLAYHKILKQKQAQLNSQSKQNKQTAYDFYGLNSINGYYGPLKMQLIYEQQPISINHDEFSHRIYDQLAHTSISDHISLYGPIKYLFRLPFEYNMNHHLEGSTKSIDIVIYEDSIIQSIFFPEKPKVSYIKKNPFFSFIQPQVKLWDTLPKIIWVFQADKSSAFLKLCMDRMQQMAKESLFEIRKVNEKSLKDYLQPNLIDQIEKAIQNVDSQHKKIISNQLYRLAILQKHGGVLINAATLAVQNFDWILKIANMPTQFIYNCFDSHPTILMMWDPMSNQPSSWDLKQLNNFKAVKSQWNQALSDTFIAAEANNELIKEWFHTSKEFLSFSRAQVANKFKYYGLDNYGVTGSLSTFSKDIVRYVLAKRQKQIQKLNPLATQNSASYYKLWTLNAFSSPYKLKSSLNYQNPKNALNPYLFSYSQDYVQAIVGKIRYILTFQQQEIVQIDKILITYNNDEGKTYFDANSILTKKFHLSPHKISKNNNKNPSMQISQ